MTTKDEILFSPAGYAALLMAFRERGYEVRSFHDMDPKRRHLILRHDVDFSLSAAQAMAEQEAEIGVKSVYFVLLRTEFYNLLSAGGLSALERIRTCGHEIGLHIDAALYPGAREELEAAVAHECTLLEAAIGRPVTTMSFHRPAPERFGEADQWAGRLNAYGPRFVKDIGYCSDSRGAWHHGEPLNHSAVREGRALQLLVHSFWWQESALPPAERLRRFLAERSQFLDRELAANCTVPR